MLRFRPCFMRVLIADDDSGTRLVLASALKALGMEISVAADGSAAWEVLKEGTGPSLALIDWEMPGIDGLELCHRIRGHQPPMQMYVILLTGRDSREDVIAGLNAGADDYIIKPFDPEELRARVQVGMRVVTLQNRLAARISELQEARDQLTLQANTDALTGLSSRRAWLGLATTEVARARRYGLPVAVLMIDLDFFKRVNDTHGHSAGDDVLREFGEVLRRVARTSDVAGRLGGEEFAILLPQTSAKEAVHVATRLAEFWRQASVPTLAGGVKLTCSIGVSEAEATDSRIEDVLNRADLALYQAKRNGRDRVELAT
jgi:two-component system cell cycle response regulator